MSVVGIAGARLLARAVWWCGSGVLVVWGGGMGAVAVSGVGCGVCAVCSLGGFGVSGSEGGWGS